MCSVCVFVYGVSHVLSVFCVLFSYICSTNYSLVCLGHDEVGPSQDNTQVFVFYHAHLCLDVQLA